ncbi:MAG TPA: VCBS repeat-containing protein [Longimicrobiales bacterium]|nr:VCBS repeat-containing protein [Longimicrobiales bacterium]
MSRLTTALLAGAGLALAACSAAPAARESGTAAAAGPFERVITPFEVLDADGRPYAHPFLGGFVVPRPQFLDIDGDGDLDLFVQERSNDVMFFENTGTASAPRMIWRTDKYRGLDVGEWFKFVDMDGDGDYDLFAEQPYSYVRLYRNEGTQRQDRFVAEVDTLRDQAGQPIFADRQNIANAADIDCNGLMDLFLGRVDGTISRYEELPRGAAGAAPRFRFVTDRFEGIEIVAQMGGSRHGANAMFFADIEGDGDLDLFWGDFFEAGILLIRNNGTCETPNLRGAPEPLRAAAGDTILTSGYNVPVVNDIDGDGDLDLFIGIIGGAYNPNRTSADNMHYYERTATGYELRTTRFLDGIDTGSESAISLADIDGDGDLDMVVGNKIDVSTLGRPPQQSRLYVFRNEGSVRAPRFRLADTLSLAPSFHYAPALADLDGDGMTDMLLGTWNDGVLHYRNQGTPSAPRWVQDSARTITITRGSNTAPALVDIDGDGDLDLFIGEASGQLNFYRNVGDRTDPRWELVSDEYEGIDVGRRSYPAFVDFDGDGDYDMIIGREEGGAVLYRNEGTRTEPRFVADPAVTVPLPALGTPVFADLDGDGRPELLSGNLSGGVFYFRWR